MSQDESKNNCRPLTRVLKFAFIGLSSWAIEINIVYRLLG